MSIRRFHRYNGAQFKGYRVFVILLTGIWGTIHFTFRDMGYCVQYVCYFQKYWIFKKNDYGDICQFIRDTCLFTPMDIGTHAPIQAYGVWVFCERNSSYSRSVAVDSLFYAPPIGLFQSLVLVLLCITLCPI